MELVWADCLAYVDSQSERWTPVDIFRQRNGSITAVEIIRKARYEPRNKTEFKEAADMSWGIAKKWIHI